MTWMVFKADRELVYVVQTDDGRQDLLTPAEFAKKYHWTNDPAKAVLRPAAAGK